MNKLGWVILGLILGATVFMASFMAYNFIWDSTHVLLVIWSEEVSLSINPLARCSYIFLSNSFTE